MKVKKNPLELLTNRRFDIIAKYTYGLHRELNLKTNWAKRLYEEHIKVFNGGYEPSPKKENINDFIKSFNKILDSIKKEGYNDKKSEIPVTLGKNGGLRGGAHRVAACLVYKKPIICETTLKKEVDFSSEYFKKRVKYVQTGLSSSWLDPMAIEYCKLKKNSYVVTVFPSAQGKNEEIKEILNKHGRIIYEKHVTITKNGALNLMRQMYSKEPWLGGWTDGFTGARNKRDNCYKTEGFTRVFLFESKNLEEVNKAKKEIRNLFKINNHSVHINDSFEDTIKLSQIFFNDNSLHFLNTSSPRYFKKFFKLLSEFKQWIKRNNFDPEHFCICGSGILAIYGAREANDLDFLHFDEKINTKNKEISSHNHQAEYYGKTPDEIIFNPENHFFYDGIKFASINVLKKMKEKRNELKDKIDLKIINNLMTIGTSNLKERYSKKDRIIRIMMNNRLFQKFNYALNRIHGIYIRFLDKIGVWG